MFDKFMIMNEKSGPSSINVKVEEKRAPTDDSIRLLREMELEVRKRILESMAIDNNTIKGAVISIEPQRMSNKELIFGKFNLNGKDYYFEEEIDRLETMEHSIDRNEKLFMALYKNISETITDKLLENYDKLPEIHCHCLKRQTTIPSLKRRA